MSSKQGTIGQLISKLTANMRFPYLFLLTAALFILDLFIPDVIPMVDEIFLALLTLVLAGWRKSKDRRRDEGPENQE